VYSIDSSDRLSDFPTPDNFERALETALRESEEVNNITFSGNGEPTLHPFFEELVDIAKRLRDSHFPEAKVGVLSNSSTIAIEGVFRGLLELDFRIMKLDAGDAKTFRKINRPYEGIDYGAILNGLQSLENITLQTLFVDGDIQNSGEPEVRGWIERSVK
jgi:wyosine [tRNA(Phe)-imidazoG37] synthetase (radical SAM superfamily)